MFIIFPNASITYFSNRSIKKKLILFAFSKKALLLHRCLRNYCLSKQVQKKTPSINNLHKKRVIKKEVSPY